MNADSPPESLDPTDWSAMRALAHRAVDESFDWLSSVRERPVWTATPAAIEANFHEPLPHAPQGAERAYQDFVEWVRPYPMGNVHPRFWSWFMGNGTAMGAIGDFLAAIVNPNMGGGNHAAIHVESQVLDWCKEMIGLPITAGGLLVSGGSMANLIGLTVARNRATSVDVRNDGVGALPSALAFYASCEVHRRIQKSLELLGLGSNALRKVPVNSQYQIDIAALESMIAADTGHGTSYVFFRAPGRREGGRAGDQRYTIRTDDERNAGAPQNHSLQALALLNELISAAKVSSDIPNTQEIQFVP